MYLKSFEMMVHSVSFSTHSFLIAKTQRVSWFHHEPRRVPYNKVRVVKEPIPFEIVKQSCFGDDSIC